MTFVITQRCCNDASCVAACPVDCIRPTPGQPDFATTEMLYIDPLTCIDCGACVPACPVNAIYPETELPPSLERYRDINANWFEENPLAPGPAIAPAPWPPAVQRGQLKVAIVGAGPAGCYAAEELLAHAGVEVSMIEKLPTPFGLVRAGVAPDHAGTKEVTGAFESALNRNEFRYYLNVEVGQHITRDELLNHHHAVVYAVGASTDRPLGVPGEDLPGSHSATEFVSWYNGHPDYADRTFDLSGERVVIVGNGNVALDIARILTADPDYLATTDIADHALEALRQSRVREVVLLGRRGPAQAAYTSPEFLALGHLPGVDVVINESVHIMGDATAAWSEAASSSLRLKLALTQEFAERQADPNRKRIVFRYLVSPTAITGGGHVDAVELVHNTLVEENGMMRAVPTARTESLPTSLVLRSIGYQGVPVEGLPFDEQRGVVPNDGGRVTGADGAPLQGLYVTGWVKRGATGVIGSNKVDARETVDHLLADFDAGHLKQPTRDRADLTQTLLARQPDLVGRVGWHLIDRAETGRGNLAGRPRVKFTAVSDMVAVARAARRRTNSN